MAGQASGGQQLTPNPNVNALVSQGGSTWGANGGGGIPIGGGVTDQTGYVKPIAITPSDCETALNYISGTQPVSTSLLGRESNAQLPNQTLDSAIVSGASNVG